MAVISHPQADSSTVRPTVDKTERAFMAGQLDADGHTVYEADHTAAVTARLAAHAIYALILGNLQHPADAPALLRTVRAGQHPRIHPGLAVITLGATDELSVLRAYDSGSDHHLLKDTGYLLLRAVLTAVMRRTLRPSPASSCRWTRSRSTWPHAACTLPAASWLSAAWSSSC
jgi:DNA-binding response OmpR family regulator